MLVTVLALIARAQGEVTAKKIADINSQAPCEAELHDIQYVALHILNNIETFLMLESAYGRIEKA